MAPKQSASETSKTSKAQASARDKKVAVPAPRAFSFSRLPDVLLAGIFDYSDLPEVAACAAASVELRAALKGLSPALERRLVVRRFPILSAIRADSAEEPPPRELFLSQTRLFAPRPDFAPLKRTINDYIFSIELELHIPHLDFTGPHPFRTISRESIFVGTGRLLPGPQASLSFDIPNSVFERAWKCDDNSDVDLFVRVMASRGYSRCALGYGEADEFYLNQDDGRLIEFFNLNWEPVQRGAAGAAWRHGEVQAVDWLHKVQRLSHAGMDDKVEPEVVVGWAKEAGAAVSFMQLEFKWQQTPSDIPMTRDDVAQALERYANWT